MRSVSDTIAPLAANRRSTAGSRPSETASRLAAFGPCEPNPGGLVASTYVPRDLKDGAPLVVVLHGCTQTAAGHDAAAGWSELGDDLGFAHGSEDRTVSSSNTEDLIGQWHHAHDVGRLPTRTERIGRTTRRVWEGADETDVMEAYVVPGMGHSTPLDATGDDALGTAAPFMLDVGICSTRRMAAFWGLFETREGQAIVRKTRRAAPARAPQELRPPSLALASNTPASRSSSRPASQGDRITNVIEDALRKAGLMR